MKKDSEVLRTAFRVNWTKDLCQDRSPAMYIIGGDKIITLRKRKRQVLDLLMGKPVYAASPVRLSDMVHLLKLEDGIDIETRMFPGDPGTGTSRYGIYVLRSHVERVSELEAAA